MALSILANIVLGSIVLGLVIWKILDFFTKIDNMETDIVRLKRDVEQKEDLIRKEVSTMDKRFAEIYQTAVFRENKDDDN